MAAVAHAHWLGVGGQGQLVAGAGIAEDVAAVPAVVLQDRQEPWDALLLTLLTPWPHPHGDSQPLRVLFPEIGADLDL